MDAAWFRYCTNQLCERRDFLLAHCSLTWLSIGDLIWHETTSNKSWDVFVTIKVNISKLIFHETTWRSVICDLKIHWIVCYIESTALWKLCERIKKGQKLFSKFYVKVSVCAKIPQYNNLSNVHNFNPRVALTSHWTFKNISTSLHVA